MVTAILLGISILFHSMNNGIHGLVFLILDIEEVMGYLMVDIIQGILAVANLSLLALVWRGLIFK
jgi:hypothetical protein